MTVQKWIPSENFRVWDARSEVKIFIFYALISNQMFSSFIYLMNNIQIYLGNQTGKMFKAKCHFQNWIK